MINRTPKKAKEERLFPWMTLWTAIAAFAALGATWFAYQINEKPTLTEREGFARIESQLDYLEVVVVDLIAAVPDSVAAGQHHASARNMGSSPQIVAYERSHSLIPLRSRLYDKWVATNSAIGETLASMEADWDTLAPVGRFEPLYDRYRSLKASKDSLVETMNSAMAGWRE